MMMGVARNENDLSFRVARNMGLSDIRPLRDGMESRTRYYEQLQEFMGVVESGGVPESVPFDDMSVLYGLTCGTQP